MANTICVADILVGYLNQEKTLSESAACLGELMCELEYEGHYYGESTTRMLELKKAIELQEKIVKKMLATNSQQSVFTDKLPHLKVIK